MLDLRDKLQFFHHVRQSYLNPTSSKFQTDANAITSITESLALLGSGIDITARWARNYYERANIQINLFFNLTTQADITMFFLPGSFVSALFSMVFFNTQSNDSGQTNLSIAPQWWLFPTATIPLTLAVFAVWVIWQRRRSKLAAILPNVEFTEDDRLTEKSSSGSDTSLSAAFGIQCGAFVHTPNSESQA
ncbi:hypothetical protein BJ165DRAFT_1409085 [Panaeolus papilionaceus]|nr:hypothetical protein BJ165DRAFT_1409085 [Panaeolus papilionaceus]